jgi:hypothetical protein
MRAETLKLASGRCRNQRTKEGGKERKGRKEGRSTSMELTRADGSEEHLRAVLNMQKDDHGV